ncbi:MAG: DUF3524 domain-containing protein [bacterium]|nr:MAG: DUF3524 domain-containing protein [bacterium]
MKILLLSAYDAASHRVWREGLVRHLDDVHWTVLTLPPRNFAWRSRGNALTWALDRRAELTESYDLLLATSMTDLAEIRGLVPEMARLPTIVYFHENQFAYPERLERREGQNYQLTNIFTALAADRVVFNSEYNRSSMVEGARQLLRTMPDCVPDGIVESIRDKSMVLPVPLDDDCFGGHAGENNGLPLTLVWNHRWEHDKAPERFFRAIYELSDRGCDFVIHVLGQRFRDWPPVFDEARKVLGGHVGRWGYVQEKEEYRDVLRSSDVVISTSLHDFQGLAVLEGAAAGCFPLVPDRLAYREIFPDSCRYPSYPEDPEAERTAVVDLLVEMCSDPGAIRGRAVPDIGHLSWKKMKNRYRDLIRSL